jgi:hypothetical protein
MSFSASIRRTGLYSFLYFGGPNASRLGLCDGDDETDVARYDGTAWDFLDEGGDIPHSDSRNLYFDANGNILDANDGGISRLIDPISIDRFWDNSITGNIRCTEFYSVAYDNVNHTIFGGAQDNGSPQQVSSGSLNYEDATGGDGNVTAVDNTSMPGYSVHYLTNLNHFTTRTYEAITSSFLRGTRSFILMTQIKGLELVFKPVTCSMPSIRSACSLLQGIFMNRPTWATMFTSWSFRLRLPLSRMAAAWVGYRTRTLLT